MQPFQFNLDLVVGHFSLGELMSAASTIGGSKANSGGAEICTSRKKTCTVSRIQTSISNILKFQNPNKTWAFVADLFGISERSSKYRLSNEASYTVEELQALIHREDGYSYLEALMADAEPAWWRELRKTMELARIRGEQAILQQRLLTLDNQPMARQDRRSMKKVFDADRKLTKTRAAQEASVGILLANAGGAPHRAVAQTKGRR